MPTLTTTEQLLLSIALSNAAKIRALPTQLGKNFDSSRLISQVISDRLELAGYHLRIGDRFFQDGEYRTSISRHYYAMYHAARAIAFATHKGDDFQQHSILPKNLPTKLPPSNSSGPWQTELTRARLIRNQADYDLYPVSIKDWEGDARDMAAIAPLFVAACSDFALNEGLI
ncbi:HEPN domain-containing protein [Rhodococcus gordoniae]|uniref:HEPN domain-containing protein n=1 Tax=Rhodococcus gordoniae TaxID=223392 RepID=UPI0009FBA090